MGYLTPAFPATQTCSTGDSAISLRREFLGLPPLTKWEAELGAQWRLSSMLEMENTVEEAGAVPLPSHSLLYPMPPLERDEEPAGAPPWSSTEAKIAWGTRSCQSSEVARTKLTLEPAAWIGASLPALHTRGQGAQQQLLSGHGQPLQGQPWGWI